MAGPHLPLSTLRRAPHGTLRMTRGQCGSLYLSLCKTFTHYSLPVSRRTDLAHMLGIDAPRIVLFEKLLQAFVSKAPYHRPSAASSLLASVKRSFTTFNQYFTGIAVRLSAPRARVPSGLTPPRRALGPAIRSAWPQRHSFPGRRHPTVRHATNAPPPPSCVGPNSASVLHRRPRGRLRQLWGSAPAPPRASALHQSSFRNLLWRSPEMIQLCSTKRT